MTRKKKSSVSKYVTLIGNILSARSVDKCDSNVHTVETSRGLFKVWHNDQLVPIGTRVSVDLNTETGKAYFS